MGCKAIMSLPTLTSWRHLFEELFYLSVGLANLKNRRRDMGPGAQIRTFPVWEFASLLPFSLTGAQELTMEEIARRLSDDAEEALQAKVSLVEPALVLITSLLVGAILLAVMLPLMHIMKAIG